MRAPLGTASHFCELVVHKTQTPTQTEDYDALLDLDAGAPPLHRHLAGALPSPSDAALASA